MDGNLARAKSTIVRGAICSVFLLGLAVGCSREGPDKGPNEEKESVRTQEEKASTAPVSIEGWGNAPDFTLLKFGGGNFTLSSLKGKMIILNFWATWCGPCRMEVPGFVRFYEKYRDRGLEIVGVSLDRNRGVAVGPFAKKMKINYILVFGNRKVTEKYGGIRGIPTSFIIDRRGNIVKKHVGFVSESILEKEIKELLEEAAEK